MISALFSIIAILLLTLMFVSRKLVSVNVRLGLIEDEARARLDILDDQMSDLGGSVIVLEARLDPGRNQGIRTFNHDYDGKPLSSYKPAIIPERFRRSGEMYVGNPNNVAMPPAATRADYQYGPVVDLDTPIVPQPFADGEPYRDLDEEIEADAPRS